MFGFVKSHYLCILISFPIVNGRWMYLTLWVGLPCSVASWEPTSAFNFDPEEFAERLPDLTGVNDSIVAELLVMAEKTCLHSPSLSLPKSGSKRPPSLSFELPEPSHPSLFTHKSLPLNPALGTEQPGDFLFPSNDWANYLPLVHIVGAEEEINQFRVVFDSGVPKGNSLFNDELRCLTGSQWLSDSPLNNLGSSLADFGTLYPEHSMSLHYTLSHYCGPDWNLETNMETPAEGSQQSQLFMMAYNKAGTHWNLVVYSQVKSIWLILDSIRAPHRSYSAEIHHCVRGLLHTTGIDAGAGDYIVSLDWPQQPNHFDCGVYTALAMMFVAKNCKPNGLIDKIMQGDRVNLPPLPPNFCVMFRKDLFCFSKLSLEPYMPAFTIRLF